MADLLASEAADLAERTSAGVMRRVCE